MEVEVTLLTRRGAAVMHRSHRVSAERTRFGRGTNNEVPLADIRVELVAATLFARDGGLVVETTGVSPLRVNGSSVTTSPVKPGDKIRIGPYEILLAEPAAGCDAALSVELIEPMGNALNVLMTGNRIGLPSVAISKRTMSWTAFLVVIVVCLATPVVIYWLGWIPSWEKGPPGANPVGLVGLSWNPGQLSNSHRHFATDCAACHRAAFTAVPDNACLACHGAVGAHGDPHADLGKLRATLDTERCTTCHQEHRGLGGLVIREASLCLDCHRTIADTAPGADLNNVTGFPDGHPQFRATLVADPAKKLFARRELGTKPPPVDRPGLHFSHAAHLVKGGFPPQGYREMTCVNCHVAAPGGQGFLPITYDGQCKSCHALKFDRADLLPWPGGTVPHGDDSGIVAAVWNFYAGKALQGGIVEPSAPAVIRQAPGSPPPDSGAPQPAIQSWVARQADTALRGVILDDKRGCAYCHFGTGPQGAFETAKFLPSPMAPVAPTQMRVVAPVVMEARFLPKARFDHAKHAATGCDDCHGARQSRDSGDVLIPGKENCFRCHGTERAALMTQSTCTTCHDFHHTQFGPMRENAAAMR